MELTKKIKLFRIYSRSANYVTCLIHKNAHFRQLRRRFITTLFTWFYGKCPSFRGHFPDFIVTQTNLHDAWEIYGCCKLWIFTKWHRLDVKKDGRIVNHFAGNSVATLVCDNYGTACALHCISLGDTGFTTTYKFWSRNKKYSHWRAPTRATLRFLVNDPIIIKINNCVLGTHRLWALCRVCFRLLS